MSLARFRYMALRQFLPRSLFGRAILILLLPMVLAQMVATYIFFDRHWENLTNRLAYGVAGDIAFAVQMTHQLSADQPRLVRTLQLLDRSTDLHIWLEPLHPLPSESDQDGLINQALDRNLRLKLSDGSFVIIDRSATERIREVQVTTPDGLLRIEVPERRLQSATAYIFILWMVGSAVLFFAIALVFMRNQVRPIRRLATAAESFGKGQEVVGFKPEGASEVRRAAQAFLVMRERIRKQIQQRTEMLAGVSHDLRTPLTRMKLQLAMMPSATIGLDELEADVEEMEHMVEGYLAFAKGAEGEGSTEVDLLDILAQLVAEAGRTGRKISARFPSESVPLVVRPMAIKRCLGNLVSNALRYASNVALSVDLAETAVFVHVDDDGPGIPEDQRDDVLRPFVRLDDSRNPETGGVGLGLSIALDVARGHGGDLMLSQSPMGGLRATVRLPR